MLPRFGKHFRISDETLKQNVNSIVEQLRKQCHLGFSGDEDTQRIADLQQFISKIATVRTTVETHETGPRVDIVIPTVLCKPMLDFVKKANEEAVEIYFQATQNVAALEGPYWQKIYSLLRLLLHEIDLHFALTYVDQNCPIFNAGLSVLSQEEHVEMTKGIIGPMNPDKGSIRLWWNRLIDSTQPSGNPQSLYRRPVVFGDAIFAISYKHKGGGRHINDRMDFEEWVALNKSAAAKSTARGFLEYFFWIDVQYSSNRDKSENWCTGGIAPYLCCEVLTTSRRIEVSFWCRLERLLGSWTFGASKVQEGHSTNELVPRFDIYNVAKYAAQTILMSEFLNRTRVLNEDKLGLIYWALSHANNRPETTVGLTTKNPYLAMNILEEMSWWSSDHVVPSFGETYFKNRLDFNRRIQSYQNGWHGIREWIPTYILPPDRDDVMGELLYNKSAPRVKANYIGTGTFADVVQIYDDEYQGQVIAGVEPSTRVMVVQLTYTHLDGSKAYMMVVLIGCDVYEAHLIESVPGFQLMPSGLDDNLDVAWTAELDAQEFPVISMSEVTWRAWNSGSVQRCDRCEISKQITDQGKFELIMGGEKCSAGAARLVSRVLSQHVRPAEDEHLSHVLLDNLPENESVNVEEVKLALVRATIGFDRYERDCATVVIPTDSPNIKILKRI